MEAKTNLATLQHIVKVRNNLNKIINELMKRGENHDLSKMEDPELPIFDKYTGKLAECTFASKTYKKHLEDMKPALDHHYANNRHHPEHFKKGIEDMNIVDIIEMLCDWEASSNRHNDGNIKKSIEINGKRFKMDAQLVKIFENSVHLLEDI